MSQSSKCLRFMYFERGILSDGIKCKYLSETLQTFYVHQFYKKMKEDNISQLGNYNARFGEQQYRHELLYLFVQIQIV